MTLLYLYANPISFLCLIAGILINADVDMVGFKWNLAEKSLVENATDIVEINAPHLIIKNMTDIDGIINSTSIIENTTDIVGIIDPDPVIDNMTDIARIIDPVPHPIENLTDMVGMNGTDFIIENMTDIVRINDPDPIIENKIRKTAPTPNITGSQILLSIFSLGIGQLTEYAHAAKLIKDLKTNGSTQIKEQYQQLILSRYEFGENTSSSTPAAVRLGLYAFGKPNFETAKLMESLPEIAEKICAKNHYAKTYGERKNIFVHVNNPPQMDTIGRENHLPSNRRRMKASETDVGWNIGPGRDQNVDNPRTNARNNLNVGGGMDTGDLPKNYRDWNIKAQGGSGRSRLSSISSIDAPEITSFPSRFIPKAPSINLPKIPPMNVPKMPPVYFPKTKIPSIPVPKIPFKIIFG